MSSLDLPYPDVVAVKLVTGVIANAPSGAGESVYVRIPSRATQDTHLVTNWDPHGSTLPAAGTACLLGEDENGGLWVLSWVGAWS